MSKQSYINGFCKQAAARGVDPNALAEFVKRAGLWDDIKNTVSNAWEKVPSNYKGLVGGGVGTAGGALGGALLGKLFGFGAGKGALLGGGLGGIGGALYGSHVGNQENIAALNKVLADQKSQSQREMDALVDANAEAIGKLQGDHKKQLEDMTARHGAELESERGAAASRLGALQSEYDAFKSDAASKAQAMAEANKRRLEKIVADHKSEMDKANAGFEKERKGLNDQIAGLNDEMGVLRGRNSDLESELNMATAGQASISADPKERVKSLAQARDLISRLSKNVAEGEDQIEYEGLIRNYHLSPEEAQQVMALPPERRAAEVGKINTLKANKHKSTVEFEEKQQREGGVSEAD